MQRIPTAGASSGQAYRIALQPATIYTITKDHPSNHNPQAQKQTARPVVAQTNPSSKKKNTYLRAQQQHRKQLDGKGTQKLAQPHKKPLKTPKIDERGLYNRGKNCVKQTGAILELKGWEWDAVPNPNDTTEECGKIVFEIKVDQDGEIISIQTIEKTVTPMVEKIYADALRALTFSKTAGTPSGISTGKVTFVLIAK
ncbi:hypothetical protein [Cardinium endosymbiont of Oedothorax gibbosus]|uniref:hypothetical protein n=1 Tax=Cardinium endosymbiont of Oedothorax gibbosus TaxID=931101 RepID=UPI0020249580|nr:hypothetical protein [Cardinium endosymbiont of Oedothorax gibbosus]